MCGGGGGGGTGGIFVILCSSIRSSHFLVGLITDLYFQCYVPF